MMHIIIGLFFIALGIWGIYDEYYYVADVIKGGLPIVMVIIGLVATLAGIVPVRSKEEVENG
jgi:hypothetical protein